MITRIDFIDGWPYWATVPPNLGGYEHQSSRVLGPEVLDSMRARMVSQVMKRWNAGQHRAEIATKVLAADGWVNILAAWRLIDLEGEDASDQAQGT